MEMRTTANKTAHEVLDKLAQEELLLMLDGRFDRVSSLEQDTQRKTPAAFKAYDFSHRPEWKSEYCLPETLMLLTSFQPRPMQILYTTETFTSAQEKQSTPGYKKPSPTKTIQHLSTVVIHCACWQGIRARTSKIPLKASPSACSPSSNTRWKVCLNTGCSKLSARTTRPPVFSTQTCISATPTCINHQSP
jgi:hypothetical protein